MSLQTPQSHSDLADPFQLQRLADELKDDDLTADQLHDLPTYEPLSHKDSFLSAPIFNVELFLQSRSYTSLSDLRSELRDYLATLKEELVQLINDDYEAFISLSTDLRREGTRLERLKFPLADLKSETLTSKRELEQLKSDIEEKLEKRSALRDEKAFLHLLLKISESVTRLESLLLIASPDANTPSARAESLDASASTRPDEEGHDERVRESRSKHLSRVAAEYTQLLYHVSKAQPGKCAFVDEIQWRIDRIRSTLFSDLDHLFATILASLTGSGDHAGTGKTSDIDRPKLMADVTECLKTYDVLGLWREAEDVLRREVVDNFVRKSIFPGALSEPRSPLVPHTPFPVRTFSSVQSVSFYSERTPYTPFTSFASKQSHFAFPNPTLQLLDDAQDPLAGLYNQMVKFVERDLKKIMEIAETICVKSGSRKKAELVLHSNSAKRGADGFEIMANVVWAEFGRAIMDELGNVIFSAGKTDEFRVHHETTDAFVRSLEFLAPSALAVEAMRSHPVYKAFHRRWQTQTYFQLRWKEIVGKLEESLVVTRIEPTKGHFPFATNQAFAVWVAISTCWSAEVYMSVLSYRFWRLTLQLLSRFKTWLDASLPAFEPPPKIVTVTAEKVLSPSISRSPTPNLPETISAETTDADNVLLKQFAAAVTDIYAVESQMMSLWSNELSIMLPETSEPSEDVGIQEAEGALKQLVSSITTVIPSLSAQVIGVLTRRACDALLPVRSIPSQFRAMQSKRMPTERSYFVPLVLRPVQTFFGIGTAESGMGERLKERFLKVYAADVFEGAAQRYLSYVSVMKKTEESLRRLKKGKKNTFSLFSGGASAISQDDGRDEERIRQQMIIDVDAFGQDAATLGVEIERSQAFAGLKDTVNAAWTEGEI